MKKTIIAGIVASTVAGGIILAVERYFLGGSQIDYKQKKNYFLPVNLKLVGSQNRGPQNRGQRAIVSNTK